MKTIVVGVKSSSDKKLLLSLIKRMGLSSVMMSKEEMEEYYLGKLIMKARKKDYISEAEVIKALKRG